ncbi:MAG: DUF4168 domain-containing protein [Microcystaceae cyanobacterium]
MLKQLLWSGGVATLLLASSLSASTLAQQISPQSPSQPASSGEISSLELQQYASTVKRLQIIQQKAQKEMDEAVKNEDLSPERFMEIGRGPQNQGTQPIEPVTPSEKESFERAQAEVERIHQETEAKMQRAVQAEGLEVGRFRQIAAIVQKNPALIRQVQQMIQN